MWKPEYEAAIRKELGERKDLDLIIQRLKNAKWQSWSKRKPHALNLFWVVRAATIEASQIDFPTPPDFTWWTHGLPDWKCWEADITLAQALRPETIDQRAGWPLDALWCIARLDIYGDPVLTSIARTLCAYGLRSPCTVLGFELALEYGHAVTRRDISIARRHPKFARPDREAAYLRRRMWAMAHQLTSLTHGQIGDVFGGYKAQTVQAGFRKERDVNAWPIICRQLIDLIDADIERRGALTSEVVQLP